MTYTPAEIAKLFPNLNDISHPELRDKVAAVGKSLEFDKDASDNVIKGRYGEMLRHPFSGVAMCYKHGIQPGVMHIVATHSHEGDKVDRSIKSIIFHHAVFVDFDIAKFLGKRAATRVEHGGKRRKTEGRAGMACVPRTASDAARHPESCVPHGCEGEAVTG